MTLPGIPCLYYGTEFDLLDHGGKISEDGETGRAMFYRNQGGPTMTEVKSSLGFIGISSLAKLRATFPVLRTGSLIPLWVDSGAGPDDDGVFAFARATEDGESFAVVVLNASAEKRVTSDGTNQIRLPANLKTAGKILRTAYTSGVGMGRTSNPRDFPAAGPLQLPVSASGLAIYVGFRE